MISQDDKDKYLSSMKEWKDLIFPNKIDTYDFFNDKNKLNEVVSFLAESSLENTTLTSTSKGLAD